MGWTFARQFHALPGCGAVPILTEVRVHCVVDAAGASLVRAAVERLGLSARAYHRVLKVARTIADLAGSETIQPAHLAEAIQYQRRGEE